MSDSSTWHELAERQHGVVTHRQLSAAGVSPPTIDRLISRGALNRDTRGIYLAGGAPTTFWCRLWQAVLATDGIVGFTTAAGLWDMTADPADRLHVIVSHSRRVAIPTGVRVHRVPLPLNARREIDALPVSARAWSALDHLSILRGSAAGTFFDRALQQEWLQPSDVYTRLNDWRGRTGNTQLRRLATTLGDGAAAESERRLQRILRSGGITGWRANYAVHVGERIVAEVDVAFPDKLLAIEVDGMAHHVDAAQFRRDRSRQNQLVLMGWTVLRFTWADLNERPEYVLRAIRQALAA